MSNAIKDVTRTWNCYPYSSADESRSSNSLYYDDIEVTLKRVLKDVNCDIYALNHISRFLTEIGKPTPRFKITDVQLPNRVKLEIDYSLNEHASQDLLTLKFVGREKDVKMLARRYHLPLSKAS